ncbi:MAG TPA: FecR domain-containing protein [Burkholderiaceae bacterium]|nr:FecR domain-containing protein [Burkholderiaceae bacterium]
MRLFARMSGVCIAGSLALACANLHAQGAGEPIGYVKNVVGDEAWIVNAAQQTKASPGTPLFNGSQVKTGKETSLGLTLKDNTLMSFGPGTQFEFQEFQYAPAKDQLKLSTRLLRGTMNFVSGVISKLRPESVSVQTPAGLIGVRGTQFVAKVEDEK